ncbi:hypothetical protein AAG570_013059, partial [Ranatra chinensis]
NGVKKTWDLIKSLNSVTIIIYNISRDVLVCVKQFRPGVYVSSIPFCDRMDIIDLKKYPPSLGITLEFCSGIVDKQKSLEEIARDEVFEECGYDIKLEDLERVQSFRYAVGIAGDSMTLFYTEVTDAMKIGKGGGLEEEGELIDVVELKMEDAVEYLKKKDVCVPPEFLYGLLWFFANKKK